MCFEVTHTYKIFNLKNQGAKTHDHLINYTHTHTHTHTTFHKIQHPFQMKSLNIFVTEGTYSNIMKTIYNKLTANIILHEEI